MVCAHLEAQTVTVPSERSCPTCSIVVTTVGTLGGARASELAPALPVSAVLTASGVLWVAFDFDGEPPWLFKPSGEFLRTIGREGKGPGEFSGTLRVASARGDSVMVYDQGNARISVYAASGVAGRSLSAGGFAADAAVMTANGEFVLAADLSVPARVGLPLHRIAAECSRFVVRN
jgi:hypothetical protein